jgi:hypothetical protein
LNPTPLDDITLGTLPLHLRQIALWLLTVLTVGYTVGLIFTYHTTSLTPKGVQERYRGNQPPPGSDTASVVLREGALPGDSSISSGAAADTSASAATMTAEEPEMKFEKSTAEMLNLSHTHILAMATFMAFSAGIFAFSRTLSPRWRSFLIVEPFVAILPSFGAMWLMRYLHPAYSYLLMASSASMACCFFVMNGVSILELLRARGR